MAALTSSVLPPPKQIRFVLNQGQPPSKRRRINAACLTCRRRKTRCSGDRPVCQTCVRNHHECLGYGDLEVKREDKKDCLVSAGVERKRPREQSTPDTYGDECVKEEGDELGGIDGRKHWEAKGGRHAGFAVPDESPAMQSAGSSDHADKRSLGSLGLGHYQSRQQQKHRGQEPQEAAQLGKGNDARNDDRRGSNNRSPTHRAEGNKVPYFRYFGPTAIVPGFKQMVVNLGFRDRDRRRSRGGSFSSTSPNTVSERRAMFATSSSQHSSSPCKPPCKTHCKSALADTPEDVPVYDPDDPSPVHALIISLIETFFLHLGPNYPFLRREKFLRMVKEKRVEPILVDAVCALSTRFSDLAIYNPKRVRDAHGRLFARRAQMATVDMFPCPSVGAVQAYLLMAYESFGQDQDSALWMYLGCAIRMAVDLGLPKKVGVKYQGEKDPWYTRTWNNWKGNDSDGGGSDDDGDGGGDDGRRGGGSARPAGDEGDTLSPEEQAEVEQERIDTFWSIFVLDRVISSGTGRPVTFREDDFEFPLPEQTFHPGSGFPDPFPTFIRIIHIYGRVSDVVNNIKSHKGLTSEKLDKLVEMETELTRLYQMQDPRLHFNAPNFQEHVRGGSSTIFILLHFWFHALIIILHQPTLLFGSLSRIHQLLPNSRELSISSAKTIADILSFAELIDPKSFIGNPFTSQPMYIAACAFLMQSGAHSSGPSSPDDASPPNERGQDGRPGPGAPDGGKSAKHSLLALGANQNYQRCYKSLQQLQCHWGGVKYILTALDQRSKGTWDCETYTMEEYEMTKRRGSIGRLPRFEIPASPNAPPIAYSLTGTTNSPNSSLTLLYQANTNTNVGNQGSAVAAAVGPGFLSPGTSALPPSQLSTTCFPPFCVPTPASSAPVSAPTPPGNMIYDPIRQSLPDPPPQPLYPPAAYPRPHVSALRYTASQAQRAPPPKMHRLSVSSSGSSSAPSQPTLKSVLKSEPGADDHISDSGPDAKLHILASITHNNSGSSSSSSSHSHHHHHHHRHGPPPPPPPQPQPLQPSSYTPSSHSSTAYEPSVLPDASPSSTLAASSPHQQQIQHRHGSGLGSGGGRSVSGGEYPSSPFEQTAGLLAGSFLPDLHFEAQEIDLSSMVSLNMPWLELPGDVLGLFEGSHGFGGSHMG